jgi:hypothetical protein
VGNDMKHRTRHTWFLAAILVAGCGSATPPGATADAAQGQGNAAVGSPADVPAAGAGVEVPTIMDAMYTSGTAHIEVTGGKSLSTDATLVPGASMSTEGTTLLLYGAGDGQQAVVISISNGPDIGLAMTITAPELTTGGDGSSGCGFELTRNDDTGVTGSFSCRGITTVGLDMATVDASGTFSAER